MNIEATFPLGVPRFLAARLLDGNGTDPNVDPNIDPNDAEEDHAYDAHNVLLLNVRVS